MCLSVNQTVKKFLSQRKKCILQKFHMDAYWDDGDQEATDASEGPGKRALMPY